MLCSAQNHALLLCTVEATAYNQQKLKEAFIGQTNNDSSSLGPLSNEQRLGACTLYPVMQGAFCFAYK
jgi:hypothetical protein